MLRVSSLALGSLLDWNVGGMLSVQTGADNTTGSTLQTARTSHHPHCNNNGCIVTYVNACSMIAYCCLLPLLACLSAYCCLLPLLSSTCQPYTNVVGGNKAPL